MQLQMIMRGNRVSSLHVAKVKIDIVIWVDSNGVPSVGAALSGLFDNDVEVLQTIEVGLSGLNEDVQDALNAPGVHVNDDTLTIEVLPF